MKRCFIKLISLLVVTGVCAFSYPVLATVSTIKKPSIVFISPDFAESQFFNIVNKIMRDAADDLGISLEILYADDNPTTTIKIGTSVLNRTTRPDYLVMVNEVVATAKLMKLANQLGQKTFLFNADYQEGQYDQYKSKTWLGSLLPDDEQAGYQLAKVLVTEARKKKLSDKNGKINIIGINGDHRSRVPISRKKGLQAFVDENNDVELLHIVNAYWSKKRATETVENLLKLFPETNLIWSASDYMASGAAIGAENMNRVIGKDMLTCGIDWLPSTFEEIKDQRLSCSIGGHIFDGAWLMVLLHDQFNHFYPDFIQKKTHFSSVNNENLSDIERIFDQELWKKIDYKKFSKAYNQSFSTSHFGSQLLIDELSTLNKERHVFNNVN
ncbi:ABC transporter substrate-binding protein [Cocleimonas sp. KMM 6892]|uniref:ABC transporter substrate-binding protein n=1 Tax=unclassified Cocleimonas TaxID=2639732 RepID=UPI002DBC6399|nr:MULTISPECIES: ABC transporter substrate-binding protein [unclassified Cocleimonas]MEB8434512.1 ABC transporter substrate-binding protein [Cocleimonas sp. KMM 6892]MEC4717405.1 ABC transporter substrate-binding protein [Cocleimonas sp. KMM 6895]MEC4746801.1 ABC transporter substrate-binding protein [Cocleimonas sp. KMM 6896]